MRDASPHTCRIISVVYVEVRNLNSRGAFRYGPSRSAPIDLALLRSVGKVTPPITRGYLAGANLASSRRYIFIAAVKEADSNGNS